METERRRCIGGEGQMTQAKLGSHLEDWVDGNDINWDVTHQQNSKFEIQAARSQMCWVSDVWNV